MIQQSTCLRECKGMHQVKRNASNTISKSAANVPEKIHFENQFNNHLCNKTATNPATIAPLGAFNKLSPECMDL